MVGVPLPPLLTETFCARDAIEVAPALLGKELRRGEVRLRITEVEAYCFPHDSANHAHKGRTERNAPMWGPPGRAYVYVCYGIHALLNVVTNSEGEAAAVLVRSAEPIAGVEIIRERRGGKDGPVMLTGPGKIGAALALDRSFTDHPLLARGGLELREGAAPERVASGPRIGIDYAAKRDRQAPWRFADADTRWVSRPKALRAPRVTARSARPRPTRS